MYHSQTGTTSLLIKNILVSHILLTLSTPLNIKVMNKKLYRMQDKLRGGRDSNHSSQQSSTL